MQEEKTKMRQFETSRPDGRYLDSLSFVHQLYQTPPKLAYDPRFTPDEMKQWQRRVRRKLRTLISLKLPKKQPEPRMVEEQARDGFNLQKWELYPEDWGVITLLMLIPHHVSARSPAPAVLCIPGSNHSKESLAGEPELPGVDFYNRNPEQNRMAWHYVQRGLVAVAVDHPMCGELSHTNADISRQDISWHLSWIGRSYEGLNVTNQMAVLRWLKKLKFIGRNRLAVSGHSLGSKTALILGLLDANVKAVVVNDFVASWRERQVVTGMRHPGWWHLVPGMMEWFDYTDLLAALAPTPILISEGGRTSDLEQIRCAYNQCHAAGNFEVAYYPEFAHEANRIFDDKPIPEGIDGETYFKYVNVNPNQHWFKADIVVPWVANVLR